MNISKVSGDNDISIDFSFKNPLEHGGKIELPKHQAVILAMSILNFCQQTENESSPLPIKIELNEKDFASQFEPKITVQDLAKVLQIKEEDIIQEVKKLYHYNILTSNKYISLKQALEIRDSLKN